MIANKSAPLSRSKVSLAVCSALALLVATPSLADPMLTVKLFRDADVLFRDADMSRWTDNYLELGAGYNSKDSFRFGQFSGLTEQGGFPIAGFNWLSRDKVNDAQYWRVYGSTLGLDSRKLQAEGGVQGRWDAYFSFDQLKKSQTESASFIHDGLGSSNLTLPAAFTTGATGANDTAVINPRLQKFGIEQGRDIYRFGVSGLAASNWNWKVSFREDQRDGTRLTGLPFSFGAGSFATGGRVVIVPYQIDDRTRQMEASLGYSTKLAQLQLGYTYSQYENSQSTFSVRNPFTNTAGQTESRMSLMPSNDFHQFSATGAYKFSKDTRLTGKLSHSLARQNEGFLPYSANLATGAAGNVAPRGSLDGKVVKTLLDVALTTKPIDKMNLKVAYQYNDSDNRTPVADYIYLSRDGIASSTTTNRRNAPLSTTENKFSVDGDYEIAPKTMLRAGLERRNVKYSMRDALYENVADRDFTNTDKLSVELRRPVSDEFLGSLGYTYTQRRGSEYDKNSYFRNTYWNQTHINNNRLNAHPSMRSFMYSDYNEDRVRASGNWTASETLSLQAGIDSYRQRSKGPNCNSIVDANIRNNLGIPAATFDTLPDTCLGRTLADGANINVDLQWQPEEDLTAFAFASYGETETAQAGRSWTRGAASTAGNETRNWSASLANRDHTFGLGLKWQPEEQWDFGGTYVFNYGLGKATVLTGSALAVEGPMPNNWNKLHSVQLFAKWDYSKQLTWRFNYLYENLKSADWAYDNLSATSVSQVLLTGQTSPRYSNHILGVSAVIKAW